jgi:hypothetical protein
VSFLRNMWVFSSKKLSPDGIAMKTNAGVSPSFFGEVKSATGAGYLLCALLVIAYCAWTLDRGFEMIDEAYYLLLAMHADSVKFYISAQQWITSGIWQITGSLVMFRAVGMVTLLTSSVLLALGVFSSCLRLGLVVDRFESKAVMLACSAIGALLYASTINLSPCYNLLASAGAYAAAGMALLTLSCSNSASKFALFALVGCAVGAEFLCKASAGIVTLALLIFWIVIFERSRFDKTFGPVVMTFGAVTFAGILLLVNTTIGEAIEAFEQGMKLFRMVQVETIGAHFFRYAIEYGYYVLETLVNFAIPVLAMIVYVKTRRAIFAQVGLAVLVATLLLGEFVLGGFGMSDNQIAAIFAMLVMALIVSVPVWNKNRSTLGLFAGLLLLPYTVAIGTGNVLFTQVIDSLAPWGVLVAVLVVARNPEERNKMPISLIGICFMVTIALQIVTSAVRPYNMAASLTKQDLAITVGNLGQVKVDAEMHQFLTEMQGIAEKCHIAPGTPYLGLYNIPGVALTLQATPVSTPWLNNRMQAKFVIERARPEELRQTIVAIQMRGNGDFPPLPSQLVGFPLGYQYCGMAISPFWQQKIQIWQSQV